MTKQSTNQLPKGIVSGGAEKTVRKFMSRCEVLVQLTLDGLLGFVSDGKMKNGFQQGAIDSFGKGKLRYLRRRREVEGLVFGIPDEAKPEERPVYGYLEHPKQRSPSRKGVAQYGDIQVVLKSYIKERTSYTVEDSMSGRKKWGKGAAVNNPTATMEGMEAGLSVDDWKRVCKGIKITPRYIEAQIYGGVSLKDVGKVRCPRHVFLPSDVLEKLKKTGIEVETVE